MKSDQIPTRPDKLLPFWAVALLLWCLVPVVSSVVVVRGEAAEEKTSPLRVVVMDPLSDQLACDCVQGYAQRKYDRLCTYIEKRLGRKVFVAYGENLADIVSVSPNLKASAWPVLRPQTSS